MGLHLKLYGYVATAHDACADESLTGWQARHVGSIINFADELQNIKHREKFIKAIGYQDPIKLNSEWLDSVRLETDLIQRPVLNNLVEELYNNMGTLVVPHIDHICADSPGAFTAADDITDRHIAVIDVSKVNFRGYTFHDFRYIVNQAVSLQDTIKRKMTGLARAYPERPNLSIYRRNL